MRCVWIRHDLETFRKRLKALEAKVAQEGIGRIYQQIFIDTYTKGVHAKLYDRKNALVAADLLNDRVIPFFETGYSSFEDINGSWYRVLRSQRTS